MLGTCAPSQSLTVVQAGPIETAETDADGDWRYAASLSNSGIDIRVLRRRRDGGRASCSRQQRTGARFPGGPRCRAPATAMAMAMAMASCVNGEGCSAASVGSSLRWDLLTSTAEAVASTEGPEPFHRFGWCCI